MNRKERRTAAKLSRGTGKNLEVFTAKVQEAIKFAQMDKLAEAETLLDEARLINAEDPELKHQLGMVYVRTGRFEEGRTLLVAAAEARPNESLYWNNLAAAYLSVEMAEPAIEAAQRAVSLTPGYSSAWQNLAFGYRDLRNHGEAISAFERAAVSGTLEPSSLASWGESLGLLGRFDEAEATVRRASEQAPDDAAILTLLGWILVERRKNAEARNVFSRSLQIKPDQFLAALNQGILMLKTPDIEGALRWLRRATSIDVKSAAAWRVLALELARHGHDEEALPAAERAARLDPNDQTIVKLIKRLKGEEAGDTAVFDFSEPLPIGPEADLAGKPVKGADGSDTAVLDFSTINFGTGKD